MGGEKRGPQSASRIEAPFGSREESPLPSRSILTAMIVRQGSLSQIMRACVRSAPRFANALSAS
jgi:hypothetical protein